MANLRYRLNHRVHQSSREAWAQDHGEAYRWYRLAADQGDAGAQHDLGEMAVDGRGMPRDDVDAHMWFDLAVAHSVGQERDSFVTARDTVSERLAADQIADARRRVREWRLRSAR